MQKESGAEFPGEMAGTKSPNWDPRRIIDVPCLGRLHPGSGSSLRGRIAVVWRHCGKRTVGLGIVVSGAALGTNRIHRADEPKTMAGMVAPELGDVGVPLRVRTIERALA